MTPVTPVTPGVDRRRFLAGVAALGAAGTALPKLLWAATEAGHPITVEVLAEAAKVAGLELTEDERELMLEGVRDLQDAYAAVRAVPLPNGVVPSLVFYPYAHGGRPPKGRTSVQLDARSGPRPENDTDLAFLSVTEQAALLRSGAVTSVELTELYLDRLERYDPLLELVVTLTRERALEDAARADEELAKKQDRGLLHGIPWGAKDLLSVAGYRTTWGAKPYENQELDETATVVDRLADAGAVLVAKLSLGALAWGDVWFGGTTRNPWNPEQGSSGSSAGSAAAAAAGLAGFAIGSETWGSIVSPSTRCGATGLRPTFGRISRHGAMALSWSMDKLGPICRSVADCAAVFNAVHGPDGKDPSVVSAPFYYHPEMDSQRHRVGWVPALFEKPTDPEALEYWDEESHRHDLATLEKLKEMGFELQAVELPDLPVQALSYVLGAEAAAAFDELTRSGRDDRLTRQVRQAWPNVFRESRMVPAVEYLQAQRVRTLLMRELEDRLAGVDVWVVPSFGGDNLLMTNLTGHPAVVMPNGFRADGTPTSITFQGQLFGEGPLLEVAGAYQEATDFHRRHPDLDAVWKTYREAGSKKPGDLAALELGYHLARA